MPRRLRIEYPGALHHVINRGNYRRDLFESPGAAQAFLRTLFEAAGRFDWRVHAYVLMRNHFHLAVETVQPTLGEGMHWLSCTIATRFNRFRDEHGHLFQGRYKSLLIENTAALARVVDYIHLNPVRAKIVPPELIANYRWSSLTALLKEPRHARLKPTDWLRARGGWPDNAKGLNHYADYLRDLATKEEIWHQEGLTELGAGWAIGTTAWRQAVAKDNAHQSLADGLSPAARADLRQARRQQCLEQHLRALNKTPADLQTRPFNQPWKLKLAQQVREECGASITWLAETIQLGKPGSLRGYLHRLKINNN